MVTSKNVLLSNASQLIIDWHFFAAFIYIPFMVRFPSENKSLLEANFIFSSFLSE